jgi:hypothetical protein
MSPELLSAEPRPPHRPTWARPRRCLLKGCEHWFRPARPQCRYCSSACQLAARRWRRWRAQQRYRATAHGRAQRQQQAQRYRQRRRTRPPPTASSRPLYCQSHGAGRTRPPPSASASEGKRWPEKSDEVPQRPCERPGCYVLWPTGSPWNPRRFCCALCRRALRRVLDREARWRCRRRRGLRRPGRRPRSPPHRQQ